MKAQGDSFCAARLRARRSLVPHRLRPRSRCCPTSTDVSATAGLRFRHVSGAADRKDYIFEAKGGGVGALDFDNDGWLDLVFAQGPPSTSGVAGRADSRRSSGTVATAPSRTCRGRRDSTTGDGAWASPRRTTTTTASSISTSPASGPDVLYHNQGNGTFRDVTKAAGIDAPGWSASAAFGDFDRDGDLDLYVATYLDVDPDRLPEERGGGTCNYLGPAGALRSPRSSRRPGPLLRQPRRRHLRRAVRGLGGLRRGALLRPRCRRVGPGRGRRSGHLRGQRRDTQLPLREPWRRDLRRAGLRERHRA